MKVILYFLAFLIPSQVRVTCDLSSDLVSNVVNQLVNLDGQAKSDPSLMKAFQENPTIATVRALMGSLRKDPDAAITCGEMIESRGFQYEIHYVTTVDGYILTNYRIINPYARQYRDGKCQKPFLLVHGLLESCIMWLYVDAGGHIKPWINGIPPNDTSNALAFLLANEGYDVWILNARATTYSTNHTHLNPDTDPEFYDFSFYEIGKYDVTASVDYIKEVTGHERVSIVAHSQGTAQMLSQMSEDVEYQNYELVFLAAPIGFFGAPHGVLGIIPHVPLTNGIIGSLKLPLFPALSLINTLVSLLAQMRLFQVVLLEVINASVGSDSPQFNVSRLPVYTSHIDRSSFKNFAHFLQAESSDHLRRYDYGKKKNIAMYGSPEPPIFDYSRINASKLVLMSGLNDFPEPISNVQKLVNSLNGPPLVNHVMRDPLWAHYTFTIALQDYEYFGSVVSQIAAKYLTD